MRAPGVGQARNLVLLAAFALAALAAELVAVAITDAQIENLAKQFGPIARKHLTGWKDLLENAQYKRLQNARSSSW